MSEQDSTQQIDWQTAPLIRSTQVTDNFRVTQNVMRFFKRYCGRHFEMEKEFQEWLCDGSAKTLGEAADAWNTYTTGEGNQ